MLTTHIRPDCDALGSTLAMAEVLRRLGKTVEIVVGYETPPNLAWIDPDRQIKQLDKDISREALAEIEVIVVLDTSAWAQMSHLETFLRESPAMKIVIDHHVSGDDLGAAMMKNDSAAATGELVAEIVDFFDIEWTPDLAVPLYAAVATDTGWYRFPSVTSHTYRIAAEFIEGGAVPSEIYAQLYESETLARLKLVGRVLSRAVTELDGRLIYTWVEKADFEQTGALPTDTEDVINMTLSVAGTKGAVILVEQPEGQFKVSLRSRGKMHSAEVAETFGGGGHKAAAGAMVDGPLEVAREKVLDAVRVAMA
ncbi:MAG: DHH family phosphoesterase [Planctomycetia bacterium]